MNAHAALSRRAAKACNAWIFPQTINRREFAYAVDAAETFDDLDAVYQEAILLTEDPEDEPPPPADTKTDTDFSNDCHAPDSGRFCETPGSGQNVGLDHAFDQTTKDAILLGLNRVKALIPNAPHDRFKKVALDPDQQAVGNKSHSDIRVSPIFTQGNEAILADWGSSDPDRMGRLSAGREQADIISHEYGHVIDGWLLTQNQAGYQKITDFLNTTRTVEIGGKPYQQPLKDDALHPGGTPSIYALENRYEYVAEAVLDVAKWGDRARPNSRKILDLINEGFAP